LPHVLRHLSARFNMIDWHQNLRKIFCDFLFPARVCSESATLLTKSGRKTHENPGPDINDAVLRSDRS